MGSTIDGWQTGAFVPLDEKSGGQRRSLHQFDESIGSKRGNDTSKSNDDAVAKRFIVQLRLSSVYQ